MDESFIELTLLNMFMVEGGEEEELFRVKEESSMDMVDTTESPPPPLVPRIIDLLTKLLNPSTCLSLSEIFHNLIVLSLVDNKK